MPAQLNVLCRKVSPNLDKCELSCIDRAPLDVSRAAEQHASYVSALCNPFTVGQASVQPSVRVSELDELPDFADSMFVEDVCVMFDEFAILARPGVESRRGEVAHIEPAVRRLRKDVRVVLAPGTVDGGDVLVVGRHVYVGQSARTNADGFSQFASFVREFGYSCTPVDLTRERPGRVVQQDCMHLKCAATKLDEGTVLINPLWVRPDVFTVNGLRVVAIDDSEPDAANVLSFEVTDAELKLRLRRVFVAKAFPATLSVIRKQYAERAAGSVDAQGFETVVDVVVLEVDEIAKAEGALTCCSLLAYATPAAPE